VLVVNTAANPVPVSIQNGATDEKVLITLMDAVLCQNSADSGSRVSVGLCGLGNAITESG